MRFKQNIWYFKEYFNLKNNVFVECLQQFLEGIDTISCNPKAYTL